MKTVNFKNLIKNIQSGKIIIENNEKFLITDDNKKFKIHNDGKFGEYIYIKNPLNKNKLFTNYISDAITCIKNGYGDVLQQITLLGMKINKVIYFINREIGEKYRKMTLEGWKNTKFTFVFLVNGKKFDINGNDVFECTINSKITKEQLQKQKEKYVNIVEKVKEYIEKNNDLTEVEKYLDIPIIFELIDYNNPEEMIQYGSVIFE